MTPAQFTTFVLRALGYDDKAGDFKVATAIAKGREIGLLSDDMLTSGGNTLLRDECVKINYNALKTAIKGTDKLLAEKLIDDGVLTEFDVQNSEILSETVKIPYDSAKRTILGADIKKAFPEGTIVKYGSIMRDASFEQNDFSPRALLLQSDAVKSYIMDDFDPNSNAHKLRDDTSVPTSFGSYASVITVLDKDLHLIGYCITPQNAPSGTLEFKTCHLDNMKEIKEIRDKSIKISKSTPEFDENLVWCELYLTSKDTEYTIGKCPAQLQFDTEKLPASMKDFKYYSTYSGGDDMTLRYAWCHNELLLLRNSEDYSNIVPRDKMSLLHKVYIAREGIVILYDGNKEPIGYAHLTGDMVRNDNLTQ